MFELEDGSWIRLAAVSKVSPTFELPDGQTYYTVTISGAKEITIREAYQSRAGFIALL